MPDIFDEVDEDLRADRARNLLRRYGGVLLVLMGLTLVGVGAYQYWDQRQRAAREALAARYIAAQDKASKDPKGARQDLADIADTAPNGYRFLARMQLAALDWGRGERDSAVQEWRAVAADAEAPRPLRDAAILYSVQHQLDTADPKALKAELQPLFEGQTPLRPQAETTQALLNLRLGRTQEARAALRQLAGNPQVPQGSRRIAQDLLATMPEEEAKPHG